MAKPNLTQARVRELLAYDPATGLFTWKKTTTNRVRVGAIAGHLRFDGYIAIRIDRVAYLAHRIVFVYLYDRMPADEVDHINGKRTDNRQINIRECDRTTNMMNAAKGSANKSGVVGVCWNRAEERWQAQIKVNRVAIHLGLFDDFGDAVMARKAAESEHGFHANHGRRA